jgi:hypothetical protein
MQREWWLTSLLRSAVPAGLLAVVAPFAPAILEWASARMGIHLALAAVALAVAAMSVWRRHASVHEVLLATFAALAVCTAAPLSAQAADVIGTIEVSGNRRLEPETVRTYLKFNVGDAYDAGKVDQSIKSLFATGLFADVRIERAGAAVLVSVVENPIVAQVAFEGNREVDKATLEGEAQLKPRSVFTRARAQADAQRILDVYRRQGRFAASVEPKRSSSTTTASTSCSRSPRARPPRSRPSISSATGPSPTASCATSSRPRSRACSTSSRAPASTIPIG